MHELSLAQEIISIVEQYYTDDASEHVTSIKVKIGKLQNVLPDSLEFCFQALIQNSKLANAKMVIENIQITVACNDCGNTSEQEGFVFVCSTCGSSSVKIVTGNELYVSEIEFEDNPIKEKVTT